MLGRIGKDPVCGMAVCCTADLRRAYLSSRQFAVGHIGVKYFDLRHILRAACLAIFLFSDFPIFGIPI